MPLGTTGQLSPIRAAVPFSLGLCGLWGRRIPHRFHVVVLRHLDAQFAHDLGDLWHLLAGLAKCGCQEFRAFPMSNIDELEWPLGIDAAVKNAVDKAGLLAHLVLDVVLPKLKESFFVLSWNFEVNNCCDRCQEPLLSDM